MRTGRDPIGASESSSRVAVFLDLARWSAAALVLVFHVRNDLFAPWTRLPHHGPWEAAVWVATSLGHAAVMIFFVLSGYLVGGAVQRDVSAGRFDLRRYAIHRFARIYAVLPAALLLGLILDGLGSRVFDYGPVTKHWEDSQALAAHLTARVFFINLLNCQTILGPTFGSNGALWSLAPEFWYYVLYPAVVIAADRRRTARKRVLGAVVAGASALFVGTTVLLYFGLWLAGAWACRVRSPPLRSVTFAWVAMLAVMVGTVPFTILYMPTQAPRLMPLLNFIADAMVAGAFANLLIVIAHRESSRVLPPVPEWIAALSKRLSGFTYTLYLTHPPLLAFVAGALRARRGARDPFLVPDPGGIAVGLAVAALACGYAYSIAWLTEGRTPALRAWLRAHLIPDTSAPVAGTR